MVAQSATEAITVNATPDQVYDVVVGFEQYPQWAPDVKLATVVERDALGRAVMVEFRAAAIGRSAHYTLAYDYSGVPEKLSWQLVKGDIVTAIDGAYTFAPSITRPGATDVTYDLSIELAVPMPGFVKRRAEVRILNTIKELKARVEAVVG